MSKRGLGKGLGALIPDLESQEQTAAAARLVEVARITPNPQQPRRDFDQQALDELAASIREHGVVQPILVRPTGDRFQLVAGERRWRAAQLAGLQEIPAVVRELSEQQAMEIALIENLQREDLNPVEEAEAYERLLREFQLKQEDLAERLGKSRSQITNTLRLLQLEPQLRQEVRNGRLSMGHAKVLLGVESSPKRLQLAERVLAQGLSVRAVEELANTGSSSVGKPRKSAPPAQDPNLVEIETLLAEAFGSPVRITSKGKQGTVEVRFFDWEDLERLVGMVVKEPPKRSSGGGFTV